MYNNNKRDNREDYRNNYNYPGRTRDLVIWIIVSLGMLALLGAYIISVVFNINMEFPDWTGYVAGYIVTLGFIIGGIIGFVKTRKKLRERLVGDVQIIRGVISGYSRERTSSGMRTKHPVYEYYIDGHIEHLTSNIGRGGGSFSVGDTIELVYNRTTGEVFCTKDVRMEGSFYWIFIGIGVLFFTLLLLNTIGIIG